jgi:hypothetical protein
VVVAGYRHRQVVVDADTPPAFVARLAGIAPLGRLCTANEIADAVFRKLRDSGVNMQAK